MLTTTPYYSIKAVREVADVANRLDAVLWQNRDHRRKHQRVLDLMNFTCHTFCHIVEMYSNNLHTVSVLNGATHLLISSKGVLDILLEKTKSESGSSSIGGWRMFGMLIFEEDYMKTLGEKLDSVMIGCKAIIIADLT